MKLIRISSTHWPCVHPEGCIFIPEFWLHGRLPSNSSVISFLSFLLIPLKLFFILALFYVYLLLEQCGCDMYGCNVPWGEDWRLLLTACFTEAGFFCYFCCRVTRTRPAGPQTSEKSPVPTSNHAVGMLWLETRVTSGFQDSNLSPQACVANTFLQANLCWWSRFGAYCPVCGGECDSVCGG